MSQPLARLRLNLDFMPSPVADQPGLFIRDPYRFSDAMLIIPPVLVECLQCFDGSHTDLDLRAVLVGATGELEVSGIARHLAETLSQAGFLEDETFEGMRAGRMQLFARQPVREPSHAGSAYPADVETLRQTLTGYMDGEPQAATPDGVSADAAPPASPEGDWQSNPAVHSMLGPEHRERTFATAKECMGAATGQAGSDGVFAIAAPHVSPEGGWRSYRAAYSMLRPEHRERTFVILATSHYGAPERFGLTRKAFRTPLGEAPCDTRLVDWLETRGGAAVDMEDYHHSFEHTVELQVIFLQHVLGPDVRILPVLCGPYAKSLIHGGNPEDDDGVKRFIEALGELREREGDRLFWVLGVDMAHMGERYQDRFQAQADRGAMLEVGERDRERMSRIEASDAAGFWDLVRPRHDDLKWCGSSPFYTFLKAAPGARGELLHYEQWNIDERSVVSFAGMAFR